MTTSAATTSRQKMIERMKTAHLKLKQDSDDDHTTSPNANEARQRMLARIAGRTFSPPQTKQSYREDNVDVKWYRELLLKSGYTENTINRMLAL
jgi:hypothetical protein